MNPHPTRHINRRADPTFSQILLNSNIIHNPLNGVDNKRHENQMSDRASQSDPVKCRRLQRLARVIAIQEKRAGG